MAKAYPRLAKWLGENKWSQLTFEYFKQHPCESSNLRALSRSLPQFLRRKNPWHNEAHLSELARFEWLQLVAHDGATTSSKATDDITEEITGENTDEITLVPGLQLLTSFYALHSRSKKILQQRRKSPLHYALFASQEHRPAGRCASGKHAAPIRTHQLSRHEFRIVNWVKAGLPTEDLVRRARRVGIKEKEFFNILFSLQNCGLIATHFRVN